MLIWLWQPFHSSKYTKKASKKKYQTMPGYKVILQDDGEIREGLACLYCKLLLKDPVQTSESGQRLCKECFKFAFK